MFFSLPLRRELIRGSSIRFTRTFFEASRFKVPFIDVPLATSQGSMRKRGATLNRGSSECAGGEVFDMNLQDALLKAGIAQPEPPPREETNGRRSYSYMPFRVFVLAEMKRNQLSLTEDEDEVE